MVKIFMGVSQVMREMLITVICMALMLLTATAFWLLSEEDRQKFLLKREGK